MTVSCGRSTLSWTRCTNKGTATVNGAMPTYMSQAVSLSGVLLSASGQRVTLQSSVCHDAILLSETPASWQENSQNTIIRVTTQEIVSKLLRRGKRKSYLESLSGSTCMDIWVSFPYFSLSLSSTAVAMSCASTTVMSGDTTICASIMKDIPLRLVFSS